MFCYIVVAFCRIGTANRIVGLLAFGCASLLRLLGKLKQSANSAGNRILGDLRFGDLAELLEALVHVIDAQLAGLTEVVRNVIAEYFESMLHFFAGFGGGLGGTAHIGVIEVGQTVGLAAGLAVGFFIAPRWNRTGCLTAAEYITRRFGVSTQKMYTYLFLFISLFTTGAFLYPIAKIIEVTADIPLNTSILLLGAFSILYVTIGGLRAENCEAPSW